MMHSNPQFIVFAGCMFSAKTSKLLMTLERFKHQHKKIMLFKPSIDDRYSEMEVVSHSGWRAPATMVKVGADLLHELSESNLDVGDVVAVDEAFMIPDIADALIWLYRNGFNIIVSTLDISSAGKVFKEVEKLLPWATHIEKCSAVCAECGADAHYTHKKQINDDDGEIFIGGSELYEPRCFSHHVAVDNRPKIHKE